MEQSPGGIKIQLDDPEDPPGWDKEMVDGRNSSLDVLLIFAALFSAISTAFIVESLGDLKPDPAERSADALLAISQKLDFIVAGQQNMAPAIMDSGLNAFAPSYSVIVVNILWLLSLSLSVAVSLIAMLAKEWCYKFMTGRSGPTYNQARRRQQKWDGIEKWKMQEMLGYLPGLMHSALLLFAVGLCIYLWGINIGAAIPVTVVTATAGCIYASTTLLPLFDWFCPYSTPATPIVNLLPYITYQAVDYAYSQEYDFDWLLSLHAYLAKFVSNRNNSDEDKENTFAHMDIVTSRMLAWMIVNCEDSRSVDVALQAISAAQTTMPLTPLEELTDWVPDRRFYELVEIHISLGASLFKLLDGSAADTDGPEIAVNRSAYLANVCLDWDSFHNKFPGYEKLPFKPVDTLVSSVLEDYTNRNSSTSSTAAVVSLLQSCAYYMVKRWPTEQNSNKSLTPTLLVRIFLQNYDRNEDIIKIMAYALASAAFAVNWYPGGEQPSQPAQDLPKRAVQVMHSYLTNPGLYRGDDAFTFGFLALFPYIEMNQLRSHSEELSSLHRVTSKSVYSFRSLPPTIPLSYTWTAHIHAASQNLRSQIAEAPEILWIPSESTAL
ncbi:hypothetical protein RhiLY_07629 [Ceratobasidium sp. AG-Ba]|nr:hypothetical protein RhiLY_07629 [Ceratobasidium sp. AG-Ba]